MKLLKCIRHGFSVHNEFYKMYGEKAYYMNECLDSNLTEEGISQALELHNANLDMLNEVDIVLVSPLYRTLQTAEIAFTGMEKKIIAIDMLKEYPNAMEETNKRKKKSILKSKFLKINFNELEEEDITYNPVRLETIDELKDRIGRFKNYLNKEIFFGKKICIIGHTTFLSYLLWGEEREMEHCKIYDKLMM